LSGGGARALSQVAVLGALEARGVRVGCIAGTSLGAMIGSLYASGYSVARLEELVRSIDWDAMFSARPERELVPLAQRVDLAPATLRGGIDGWKLNLPRALQSDYRLNRMITEFLAGPNLSAGGDFDRLPIPFRAVATDLATGERVVLASGSLEHAVRASLAFPPLLPPVLTPQGELVDGGAVDNLPVDVVRAMGADVVIAIDASQPPLPPEKYSDAAGVLTKLVEVLMKDRNEDFRKPADVTVTPSLPGIDLQQYARHEEILARGREAGSRDLAGLPAAIAPDGNSSGGSRSARESPASAEGREIQSVKAEGNRSTADGLITDVFGVRNGERLALEEVLRGVDALHATRLFESIWIEMKPVDPGAVDLVVHVREESRLVLETGTASNEADAFAGWFRIRDRSLFGWGENLALTTFASAVEVGGRATLAGDRLFGTKLLGYYGRAEIFDEKPRVFRDHVLAGRAEVQRARIALGLQRQIGPAVLLRAGLGGGRVTIRPRAALPSSAGHDDVWALEASAIWDTLDDPWRPRRGGRLAVSADKSLEGLGATHRYERLLGQGRAALPLPFGVLQAEVFAGVSKGDVPFYDLFRLGGPSLMPGFHRDELWGRQALAGALSHSVDVGLLRLTARVGAGRTFDERRQIEVSSLHRGFGLSAEYATKFGPIMLGWGRSSDSGSRFYFGAGRSLRF
jgi:NTE family protein